MKINKIIPIFLGLGLFCATCLTIQPAYASGLNLISKFKKTEAKKEKKTDAAAPATH